MKFWKARLICFILGIGITKEQFIDAQIKQYKKGIEKYGKTLSQCSYSDYDWQEMAIEEVVDGMMYARKFKGEI